MSKETIKSSIVSITRPNEHEECAKCCKAADALASAFRDNITYGGGKYTMTLKSVDIECGSFGGQASKQIEGHFINGPNTSVSIRIAGEVEIPDQNGNLKKEIRKKIRTYKVDCPHYYPQKNKPPENQWIGDNWD